MRMAALSSDSCKQPRRDVNLGVDAALKGAAAEFAQMFVTVHLCAGTSSAACSTTGVFCYGQSHQAD